MIKYERENMLEILFDTIGTLVIISILAEMHKHYGRTKKN
jgi:hypothetical protein